MRVLVSAVGTRGDVQPALALGVALRGLGHEARLCVPPNFVEGARALGFTATSVGVEMRAPRGAPPPTPEELRRLQASMPDLITDQFDVLGAAVVGCDVVVGAGAHQYAARSVAEVHSVPYVDAVYAPVSLPTPELAPPGFPWEPGAPGDNARRWADYARGWNERARDRVNTNRARLGLAAVDDVLGHILAGRAWLAADPVLAPLPATPGLEVLQTGAWLLPDERVLTPEVERFLDAGEPPVYLGFGSMPAPADLGRTLVEAARTAGRRAVLSAGWAELGAIDDANDCLVVDDVSHEALFPRVAAVVHHGGAGTTTAAARAGVPQVLVPRFSDQPYWAHRVRALGIGTSVPFAELGVDALGAALDAVRDPGHVAGAASLAARIVTDGAVVAARRVVELVG